MKHGTLAISGGPPAVSKGVLGTPPSPAMLCAELVDAAKQRPHMAPFAGPRSAYTAQFERDFAEFCGARYCIAMASATDAIWAALTVQGIGRGHEVIVPDLTFVATALAVQRTGATVVFCDINPLTYNIDAADAERRITPNTRAIVIVDCHGDMADPKPFESLARTHGLILVDDAAQAAGASLHGIRPGAGNVTAAYSFNEQKPLNAGEGGALVTNDEEIMLAARSLVGWGEEWCPDLGGALPAHWVKYHGTNSRMHPLAALLLSHRIPNAHHSHEIADRNAALFTHAVRDLPGVHLACIPPGSVPSHHMLRVRLGPDACGDRAPIEARTLITEALQAEGVPWGYWCLHPVSRNPAFRRPTTHIRTVGGSDGGPLTDWHRSDRPVAADLLESSGVLFRLPHPLDALTDTDMGQIANGFDKVFSQLPAVLGRKYTPDRLAPRVAELED